MTKKANYKKKRSVGSESVKANQAESITIASGDAIRLNKYIASAGVCSRRDADVLIKKGEVKVNGNVVGDMGVKVNHDDEVTVEGKVINPEKKVYVLLNKPKGFVTTTDDPQDRKKVMDLVKNACKERIYPVGRLDKETTGLLLFTNDGELAKKLTHPSHNKKKIYHVFLEQAITKNDIEKIASGLELEDGFITPDAISYVKGDSKKEVGIEIHSGKNRIVRRIFAHLGYKVVKLDRVFFAGLTKRNLTRGRWRFLTQEEINQLKMI